MRTRLARPALAMLFLAGAASAQTPVELFRLDGDPLDGEAWRRSELGRYSIPQNAEPVDLDGDGDLDIVVGTRGENRLVLFENLGGAGMELADIDFVGTRGNSRPHDGVFWLEQVRTGEAVAAFRRARAVESDEVPLP